MSEDKVMDFLLDCYCQYFENSDNPGKVQNEAIAALNKEREDAGKRIKELEDVLKTMMRWIGPPPRDRHSFDSTREDVWDRANKLFGNIIEKE